MKFLNYTNKTAIGRSTALILFGALLGLASPSALAQGTRVVQAEDGDFLLAFRRPQNQSGTYLANLGPVSQLLDSTPGQAVPVPGVPNLAQDLAVYTVFENDVQVPWHSSSGVLWGGLGRNDSEGIGYITKKRPSLATQSAPWSPLNLARHNTAFTTGVGTVIRQGYNNLDATANNPRGGYQEQSPANSNDALYYYQVQTRLGGLDFGTWTNIEGDFDAGAADSALDLYEHRKGVGVGSGTVTYIGFFSISQEGVVSFTRAGTPGGQTDSDGDGFTDEEEALAGTDPNDPSSFFSLPAPVKTATGETRIQLGETAPNRRYIVQYSENLQGWTQVHVHLSGPGSDPLDFLDDDAERNGNPKGFYRVTVELGQ